MKPFLICAAFFCTTLIPRSAFAEDIYVYGQYIPIGFYTHISNTMASNDMANFFSTGGRMGPPPWVAQYIQWREGCVQEIHAAEWKNTRCLRQANDEAVISHMFCSSLTSQSFGLNAAISYKFFTGGITYNWTKDNYTQCADGLNLELGAVKSRCEEDRVLDRLNINKRCPGI